MPKTKDKVPALILVHGSGPHDRDETIGPNKPFRDLAWGLASKQIAVLRYEKRTLHYAAQLNQANEQLTVEAETVVDAERALQTLKDHDRIDPKRIYYLGHSLGGYLLPRIGQRVPAAAGLIVLAGSSRPLEDLILEQFDYLLNLDQKLSDEEKEIWQIIQKQVELVKSEQLTAATPDSDLPLNIPPAYWLDLRSYEPVQLASSLPQPFLILQGERDYQVTTADYRRWQEGLAMKKNVTFKLYPDLNHLFVKGTGKSKPAEYEQMGQVAEVIVQDIANWIKQQTP